MSIKALLKDCGIVFIVFMLALFALGLLAPSANAAEAANEIANNSMPIVLEFLTMLVGSEKAALWLAVLGFIGFILNHVRAWVPARYVAKLPRFVVWFIEKLAANYGGAKNELPKPSKRIT